MGKSDSLYKYTKLEFVISTLNHGIFASPIQTLNDPYESKDFSQDDDYRIVCLSRSRNQKMMWSHYANGHRGCAIRIALPEDYSSETSVLKRVIYTNYEECKRFQKRGKIFESLYMKDKKWSKELEVRAVYSKALNSDLDCWKRTRGKVFYKAQVTNIDFGCNAHLDSYYLDALISIRDYNSTHKKKINVGKYCMSDDRYLFNRSTDFDYNEEIEKIINA